MAGDPRETETPSIPTLELVDPSAAPAEGGTGSIELIPPIGAALRPPIASSAALSAPVSRVVQEEEKTDPGIQLAVPRKLTIAPAPKPAPAPVPRAIPQTAAPAPRPVAGPAPAPNSALATPAAPPRARMPDLGSLNDLMRDPSVSEIMINDTRNVMIEREGNLTQAPQRIDADELARIVRAILDITTRTLTPEQPYVDASLADGSRVNIVSAPLVLRGPCVTIRKFPTQVFSLENLLQRGMLDKRAAYFLSMCVIGKANLLISGGTGGGKTTLLNALAAYVPRGERIVSIEDTPELRLGHPNSVQLITKPLTPGGVAVTTRELLANALRMRPDRIIVGECRRGEALDMLQAMNTGHQGSMTTIHANTPRDALSRLETLCLMSGLELPFAAARKQIAAAIDLVIQVRRLSDGRRRVSAISEVTGMEGDVITLQDIFAMEGADGEGGGTLRCTGYVPRLVDSLAQNGAALPANYFA